MLSIFSCVYWLDLEKAEEPEIKLPTSTGSSKKQESSRRASTSTLLTMPQHLTVWITTNYGKFFKSWEYQTTLPASWEIRMQVKKQQLELGMEQQTVSKLGEGTSRLYIVTLLIWLICGVHHAKCWVGWSTIWIKSAGRNVSILRYADDTTLMIESEEPLDENERGK